MGIKDLGIFVTKCPHAQRVVPLSLFKGKKVAVDANNILVTAITAVWRDIVKDTKYPYETPNMGLFIQKLLRRFAYDLKKFLESGITPIYIFDGKSPPEKGKCRDKRNAKRIKHEADFQAAMMQGNSLAPEMCTNDHPIIVQIKRAATYLYPCDGEIIGTMKEFLGSLGIPIIQCNEEAERLCAQLCLSGHCSAAYTKDRDTLAHGCPLIMVDLPGNTIYNGAMTPAVEIIDLQQILIGLGLKFEEFVDMCIMLGCDYNDRIPQIGPKKIETFIQKFRRIHNIPNEDINRYFKTYIKKHPDSAYLLEDPKSLLEIEACYRRFAPADVFGLLSEYDLEIDVLNTMTISSHLTSRAMDFLSSYGMNSLLNDFVTLMRFHPPTETYDNPPCYPPDIYWTDKMLLVTGTHYFEIWGI